MSNKKNIFISKWKKEFGVTFELEHKKDIPGFINPGLIKNLCDDKSQKTQFILGADLKGNEEKIQLAIDYLNKQLVE